MLVTNYVALVGTWSLSIDTLFKHESISLSRSRAYMRGETGTVDIPIENLNVDFLLLRAKNGKSGNGLVMGQGKLS